MSINYYSSAKLLHFATGVLTAAGLQSDRAELLASTLLEADLMGHTTHGLQLLPAYVKELEEGGMTKEGEPEVVSDHGSAITWDGNYLPGPWLVHKAIDMALERIDSYPVVTIVIKKSHHIACLATYPERVTQKGLMMLLSCSDPRSKTVAPFGGLTPVYSPNPLAMGIPSGDTPIIFDISMSATANGYVNRAIDEGTQLPHPWLLDSKGQPTSDPQQFTSEPPATILPLGGMDSGYKGFALGIMIEAMTGALGGYGRADHPEKWGASVFLQIINPAAFGGLDAFKREIDFFKEACKQAQTVEESASVRIPGERALTLRDKQKKEGVALYPSIVPALQQLASNYNISFPGPLS